MADNEIPFKRSRPIFRAQSLTNHEVRRKEEDEDGLYRGCPPPPTQTNTTKTSAGSSALALTGTLILVFDAESSKRFDDPVVVYQAKQNLLHLSPGCFPVHNASSAFAQKQHSGHRLQKKVQLDPWRSLSPRTSA